MDAPDLRKVSPRAPQAALGGFAIAARAVDKCRAELAGTCGEFHYDCPLDKRFFGFSGIDAAELKRYVSTGADDAAVGEWIRQHAKVKSPAAIAAWSTLWRCNPLFLYLNVDDWLHASRQGR